MPTVCVHPAHLRALSQVCSKKDDRGLHLVYAEAVDSERLRLTATDSVSALFLLVGAMHDLSAGEAVLLEPIKAMPKGEAKRFPHPAQISDTPAAAHPLKHWQKKLDFCATSLIDAPETACFDPARFKNCLAATTTLEGRMSLHTREGSAAFGEITAGFVGTDEIALFALMPLATTTTGGERISRHEHMVSSYERFFEGVAA